MNEDIDISFDTDVTATLIPQQPLDYIFWIIFEGEVTADGSEAACGTSEEITINFPSNERNYVEILNTASYDVPCSVRFSHTVGRFWSDDVVLPSGGELYMNRRRSGIEFGIDG